jgi:hypothetical protein
MESMGYIKKWAQDARNSYAIKLKYMVVPRGIKLDTRYIDTPYRFQSYAEARQYAKEIFPCYSYTIEGSRLEPNFNETTFLQKVDRKTLYNPDFHKVDYNDGIYGVKLDYTSNESVREEYQKALEDIKKIRAQLQRDYYVLTQKYNSSLNSSLQKGPVSDANSKMKYLYATKKMEDRMNRLSEGRRYIEHIQGELDEREAELRQQAAISQNVRKTNIERGYTGKVEPPKKQNTASKKLNSKKVNTSKKQKID